MSLILTSPSCMPCEKYKHNTGVLILDENGNPVSGIKGTLTDAAGNSRSITLTGAPIVFDKLPGGEVTLRFEAQSWLKEMKTRKPFDRAETHYYPAQTWCKENSYDAEVDCEREFIEATMGDFIEPEEGEHLPSRHQAGAAGEVCLFAAMSTVVMIRGFTAIKLRVGIFFDGTGNNTYSAKWGKKRFDAIRAAWFQRKKESGPLKKDKYGTLVQYEMKDEYLPNNCTDTTTFDGDLELSATNELTNVQKMFDLYSDNGFSEDGETFTFKTYVTGIGTSNSTAEEKADEQIVLGEGLGIGKWGVASKTQTAIEQICRDFPQEISNLVKAAQSNNIDSINKIEIDTYGFSRGAAASRDFINHVLDGENGDFAQAFMDMCQGKFVLADGFDWSSNDFCEITFAGLFDTVPSVIHPLHGDVSSHNVQNPNIRLWIDPKRVKRAIHIVANNRTEYRFNFSLCKLNSLEEPHFTEIYVVGSHSDIGGGYYSSVAFGENGDGYLLPRYEKKLLQSATVPVGFFKSLDTAQKEIEEIFEEEKQRQLKQGWREETLICKTKLYTYGKQQKLVGQLEYIEIPEGDLSRLYLRVMYGLSEFEGVPVSESGLSSSNVWQATSGHDGMYYPVKEKIHFRGKYRDLTPYPFGELCEKVLQEAKQGQTSYLEQHTGDKNVDTFFRLGMIHHSVDENLAVVVRPFGANVEGLQLNERDKARFEQEKALSQCDTNCQLGDGYYRRWEYKVDEGQ